MPIIRLDGSGRRIWSSARWGLIPHWNRDPNPGTGIINARAETIYDKPAFKDAARKRHCIVPAMSFFEWKDVGERRKIKYRISRTDGRPLLMAGIWDEWRAPDGIILETFAVITCSPNADVSPIHDRMPVLIDSEHANWWLDASQDGRPLLQPAADGTLRVAPA